MCNIFLLLLNIKRRKTDSDTPLELCQKMRKKLHHPITLLYIYLDSAELSGAEFDDREALHTLVIIMVPCYMVTTTTTVSSYPVLTLKGGYFFFFLCAISTFLEIITTIINNTRATHVPLR